MNAPNRVSAGHLIAAVALALVAGLIGPVAAQETAMSAGARKDLQELKSRVDQRFTVMVLRQGIVLVPQRPDGSYNNIEIADDGLVLIDGTPVTGRELRTRVPGAAELVAQLSFLDGNTRRALFAPRAAAGEPPASPAPPEVRPPSPPEVPAIDRGWIERERFRHGGARVRVGGDVRVKEGEIVGDVVVAVIGNAIVDGRVDGDVVAVLGDVTLGPRSIVGGNVVAVGGSVQRAEGSRVDGDLSDVSIRPTFGPLVRLAPWREWRWFTSPFGAWTDLVASLLRMAVVGLLAAVFVALGSTSVRRVADVATAEPWRAALAGLAAQIFFVPLLVMTVVVLVVSIIGIPLLLLVPFALLAVLGALLLGIAGVGCAIGNAIGHRSGHGSASLLVSLVVGLAIIWSLTVIARFVGLVGPPVTVLVGIVLAAGFVLEYAAWTVGLGAVLISRFGRRGPALPSAPASAQAAFDIPPVETI